MNRKNFKLKKTYQFSDKENKIIILASPWLLPTDEIQIKYIVPKPHMHFDTLETQIKQTNSYNLPKRKKKLMQDSITSASKTSKEESREKE